VHWEVKNVYTVFVRRTERKRELGRARLKMGE
jgi:hypothetical protein